MNLNSLIAQDPFGTLNPPVNNMSNTPIDANGQLTGIMPFLNSILRLLFIAAGIWVFFNLVWAGFMFINAGGDAEAVAKAWSKIYMSILGLVIIVTSFLVAVIIGMLMFGNPMAILNPSIGPRP